MSLPKAVVRPCNECPWRRDSPAGWLGPDNAPGWIQTAQSDAPIACHMTLPDGGGWEGASQCKGAAIFRANICKSPRDPEVARAAADRETIFARPDEFIAHHNTRRA